MNTQMSSVIAKMLIVGPVSVRTDDTVEKGLPSLENGQILLRLTHADGCYL